MYRVNYTTITSPSLVHTFSFIWKLNLHFGNIIPKGKTVKAEFHISKIFFYLLPFCFLTNDGTNASPTDLLVAILSFWGNTIQKCILFHAQILFLYLYEQMHWNRSSNLELSLKIHAVLKTSELEEGHRWSSNALKEKHNRRSL